MQRRPCSHPLHAELTERSEMPPCGHNPVHCLVPPYILENLARSPDPAVRDAAVRQMLLATEFRTRRQVYRQAPMLGVSASPAASRNRLVYDAQGRAGLPGKLVLKEGDAPAADAAATEAYNHSGTVYDFYFKLFQRNSLDGKGMTLVSSVHVGDSSGHALDNAFWDGTQMAYGDGDGKIFTRFTKALDVVGHELTHGVQQFTSNLEYQGQSGALNEHFSDVFGILVRQWKKKQTVAKANWLIGDEIIVRTPTRRALRDMENPGTAYRNDPDLGSDPQPAHMKQLYRGTDDEGGVHINSGIPNRAFVLTAQALGGNAWEGAGKLWFQLMTQLPSHAQFADAARIARQIGKSQDKAAFAAVDNAWKQVGL